MANCQNDSKLREIARRQAEAAILIQRTSRAFCAVKGLEKAIFEDQTLKLRPTIQALSMLQQKQVAAASQIFVKAFDKFHSPIVASLLMIQRTSGAPSINFRRLQNYGGYLLDLARMVNF